MSAAAAALKAEEDVLLRLSALPSPLASQSTKAGARVAVAAAAAGRPAESTKAIQGTAWAWTMKEYKGKICA